MGSFDEEWARLQAEARDQPLPLPGGGTGGDRLTVRSDAQRAAADFLQTELLPDARREGDRPVGELESASARMSGWASATGLRTVADTWAGKVELLTAQLGAEAEALRGTSNDFAGGELEIAHQLTRLGLVDGTE
ncbi:hypothetical protein DEH69_08770 [Streptomyces sp. PT12]|nr:hypothetical protein DEH69_08770 [Streptomyces sp. PT12]